MRLIVWPGRAGIAVRGSLNDAKVVAESAAIAGALQLTTPVTKTSTPSRIPSFPLMNPP